jgi:multicomponent Na+:H+ antiporter subunit G
MIFALIGALLAVIGACFALIAAVGVWRMQDVYAQLHCTTKAATLGAALLVLALAVNSGDPGVWARAVILFVILVVTGPIAGHAISRAAWAAGIRPQATFDEESLGEQFSMPPQPETSV